MEQFRQSRDIVTQILFQSFQPGIRPVEIADQPSQPKPIFPQKEHEENPTNPKWLIKCSSARPYILIITDRLWHRRYSAADVRVSLIRCSQAIVLRSWYAVGGSTRVRL